MPLIVSEYDTRTYRLIKLENELEAMLIHDDSADKAGAAMEVATGFWNDPEGTDGLAHFCEHMLFLGTKKYPVEKSYNTFLTSHGGSYNGYTSSEATNYMFEVAADHLEGALDMFSQFFIEPTFTESGVAREVEAIQSEHAKNLQSDLWRLNRVYETLASATHPMSKFGTGSSKTLQIHDNLREQVISFWKTHYSANVMKLVVLGKQSLDELEAMVRSKFAAVENRNVEIAKFSGKPFEGTQSLGSIVATVPIANIRKLSISWPMELLRGHFRSKPDYYISHLMGHEGEGSILSLLKKLGWATGLVAGSRHWNDHSAMTIGIDLSPEGLNHVDEMVNIVYAYIALMKDHGITKELFHELTVVGDLAFRFKDKEDPFMFVSSTASNMQTYPAEYVLYGSRVHDQYEPELIRSVLEKMVPEAMIVGISSPTFKKVEGEEPTKYTPNMVEEHYGVEYRADKLDASALATWNKTLKETSVAELQKQFVGLATPKLNPFMPDDLTLAHAPTNVDPAAAPTIVLDTPTIRLWHKQDQTFKRPRALMAFEFRSPLVYTSPLAVVKTKMVLDYLTDDLNEFGYDAQVAGLKYALAPTIEGFTLTISGYNCKQEALFSQILQKLTTLEIDSARFELLRARNLKTYQNVAFGAAYALANYQLSLHFEQPRWNYKQYMAALETLDAKEVQLWIPHVIDTLYVEMLAIGNIDEAKAKEFAELIQEKLKPRAFQDGQFMQLRSVRIDPGSPEYWMQQVAPNPRETNSAIFNVYQVGLSTEKAVSMLELLNQILSPMAFDTLRTQEQLGYIVATMPRTTNCVDSFAVVVQSDKVDPVKLDERVEAWMATVGEALQNLSQEEFEGNRDALIALKLEKFTSIRKEGIYYWDIISAPHTYDFKRRENEAEFIANFSKQELIDYWNTYFAPSAPRRAKASVQTWTHAQPPSDSPPKSSSSGNGVPVRVVDDPFIFKSTMPLHAITPIGIKRMTVAEYEKTTKKA